MTATRRWGHMSQARRGRETLPSPTPHHTTLPCCCSRLRRTTVGLEPTIFGIVLRRLVHQAKEALNAIRPPRALNARPWQLRLFGSQAWGLLGRAKQSLRPPPPRAPKRWRGAMGGTGRRGGVGQMVPKLMCTPCGTRAHNLRIRGPTPCPLGQGGLDEGPSLRIL